MKKKRSDYMSKQQRRTLVEYMQKHPQLVSYRFSAAFTYKDAKRLWMKVSELLNSIPGAVKEWQQWKKCWQDVKRTTKSKSGNICRYRNQIGGGPKQTDILTVEDEKVLSVIENIIVEGNTEIKATNVEIKLEDFGRQDSPKSTINDLIRENNLETPSTVHAPSTSKEPVHAPSTSKKVEHIATPTPKFKNGKKNRLDSSVSSNLELVELTKQKIQLKREELELKRRRTEAAERNAAAQERIALVLEKYFTK